MFRRTLFLQGNSVAQDNSLVIRIIVQVLFGHLPEAYLLHTERILLYNAFPVKTAILLELPCTKRNIRQQVTCPISNLHSIHKHKYYTQNYWVSGLCPSSGILNTRKHTVSETGFCLHLQVDPIYIGSICLRTPATTPNVKVRKQSLHITTGANWVGYSRSTVQIFTSAIYRDKQSVSPSRLH
jgi:hypothetical protein